MTAIDKWKIQDAERRASHWRNELGVAETKLCELKDERDRLLKIIRAVSAAEPELEVRAHTPGRKVCLCGAGSEPGSEDEIRHYAHCVVMMARAAL